MFYVEREGYDEHEMPGIGLVDGREKQHQDPAQADEHGLVSPGTCQSECPSGAISEGDIYKIDPNVCVDCGTCADVCPTGSIEHID